MVAATRGPETPLQAITCDERCLALRFSRPQRCLSWALVRGGFSIARGVVWHRVTNAELPRGRDPKALLEQRLEAAGHGEVVGLLTSAGLEHYIHRSVAAAGVTVDVVATVGLSNALRVGDEPYQPVPTLGTINISVSTNLPLAAPAMVEAIALISEARSVAVLESGASSYCSGRPASGTGTDCFVLSAALEGDPEAYAGKHTQVGRLIGLGVEGAVREGATRWLEAARAHT